MKKVFSYLCAGTLVVLATACGGNKAAEADSDSMVAIDTMEVVEDTIAPDDTVVAEVAEEAAATPAEEVKKAPAKAKDKVVNKAKEEVSKVDEAVKGTMDKAIDATKNVAEKGVSDAKEKANAWRDKKKNQNNN